MTFRIIKGDLFDPNYNFTALAQGVNCRGVMGAGIAVPFKQRFPDMFEDYKALCSTNITHLLPGTAQVWIGDGTDIDVVNIFSQFHPGPNAHQEYLDRGLFSMDQQFNLLHTTLHHTVEYLTGDDSHDAIQRIGLPLIGGGIGGLARHNIINSMELILGPSKHEYTLVERD